MPSTGSSIPSTMRAAVIHAWNEVSVDEVPVPAIGPGEVLVRVRACGICPTDLRIVAGAYAPHWPPALPFIYGHEWSGEIAAVGEGEAADACAVERAQRCGEPHQRSGRHVDCARCQRCLRRVLSAQDLVDGAQRVLEPETSGSGRGAGHDTRQCPGFAWQSKGRPRVAPAAPAALPSRRWRRGQLVTALPARSP